MFNPDFDNLKVEDIFDFLDAYEKGSLPPHFKSEPYPEGQSQEIVKTLVGKTHNLMVYEAEPAALNLVLYWAPYCKYSQLLLPTYEKLAEKFGGMVTFWKFNT